jgi:ketosteroid isomerase-like protein
MSLTENVEPASIQTILQSYLALYARQNWDEWIDLWADDGILEFPFAPTGRKSHYAGKADILAYMKATAARMAGRIKSEGLEYFTVRPMQDPSMVCLEMAVKGRVLETNAPYKQTYISIVESQGRKISLYREYWNPLVSIDANGGREAWTAAFGSPAAEGDST